MIDALTHLKEENSDAFRLARLASLAARVEPELLRALRVEIMEEADAAAEADLWWSHAVDVRSATGIRLSVDALTELRNDLGEDTERAYAVIKKLHAGAPRLIQLEEQLTFAALTGGDVTGELERVLGTLLDDQKRAGHIASWAITALPRLPPAVRDLPVFWSVLFAADAQGRGSASLGAATPSAQTLTEAAQLLPSLAQAGWVQIDAHLKGEELSFSLGAIGPEHDKAIFAPNTHPVLLVVESSLGSHVVAVPRAQASTPVKVRGPAIAVRSLGGRTHQLEMKSATGGDLERPWIGSLGKLPWRLWPSGTVLSVSFEGRHIRLQRQILQVASEWSEHAALRFIAAAAGKPGDVRVAFKRGQGSWSMHGTESEQVPLEQPTMNLEVKLESEGELRSIVLHEFGHVLGLVNEAQSPSARIAWNAEALYEWGVSAELSRKEVDDNLLGTYAAPEVHHYRAYDADSVMLNPVSKEFTLDGFSSTRATHLSESDAGFARELYPEPTPVHIQVTSDGLLQPVHAKLFNRQALRVADELDSKRLRLDVQSRVETRVQLPDGHVYLEAGGGSVELAPTTPRGVVVAARQPFVESDFRLGFEVIEAPSATKGDNLHGLSILRRRLRQAEIPERKQGDHEALFGVWHLSAFGKRARSPFAIELIAEVLRRFDLTLIDEVHDDAEIERTLRELGDAWRVHSAPGAEASKVHPLIVYDTSVVRTMSNVRAHSPQAYPLLKPQVFGAYNVRGIRLRVLQITPSPNASSESIAESLIAMLHGDRHSDSSYDLTLVVGFMGIEGPTSPALQMLEQADITIPSPLTRQGANPALDQIVLYPASRFRRTEAGLVDLYQNSPRALFPESTHTNEEAVAQLALRSPTWARLGSTPLK